MLKSKVSKNYVYSIELLIEDGTWVEVKILIPTNKVNGKNNNHEIFKFLRKYVKQNNLVSHNLVTRNRSYKGLF